MELNTADFTPLDQENRAAVPTELAALHLSRRPQTLRIWACKENGPIRPLRLPGSKGLLWSTNDLKRLVGLTPSTNSAA